MNEFDKKIDTLANSKGYSLVKEQDTSYTIITHSQEEIKNVPKSQIENELNTLDSLITSNKVPLTLEINSITEEISDLDETIIVGHEFSVYDKIDNNLLYKNDLSWNSLDPLDSQKSFDNYIEAIREKFPNINKKIYDGKEQLVSLEYTNKDIFTIREGNIIEIPKEQLKSHETAFESRKQTIIYQVATGNIHNFKGKDKEVLSDNFNEITSVGLKGVVNWRKDDEMTKLKEVLSPNKENSQNIAPEFKLETVKPNIKTLEEKSQTNDKSLDSKIKQETLKPGTKKFIENLKTERAAKAEKSQNKDMGMSR